MDRAQDKPINKRRIKCKKRKNQTKFVKHQKLMYFGYIQRHERLGRTILEGVVEEKGSRGRQSREWEKDITKALRMPTAEAERVTRNRSVFRSVVTDARERFTFLPKYSHLISPFSITHDFSNGDLGKPKTHCRGYEKKKKNVVR